MSYETFKEKAAARGLTDLTQDEYDKIVQAHPGASTPALVRFVKASRKGVVGSGERTQNTAFALGARDHVYPGITIAKAAAQKITLLFPDGRMTDFMWKGAWDGIPGRLHEVEVEEGERQKKDSDDMYVYRDLKVATVQEGRVDPSTIPLTDMTRVDESDLYTTVAFAGIIRGIWPETIWENKQQAGEYPYVMAGRPTCSISFKQGDTFVNAHFGPYKQAVPYVVMEDWDVNVAKTLEDLTGYMYEAEVIIVGQINSIKEKKDKDTGEETTYVHLGATALFDADEMDLDNPMTEKEAPRKEAKVVHDPAKQKSRAKDMITAMLKGIKVIGPDCTIAELKGKYIDEDEDEKMANMAFKIAMKQYQESKKAGDTDATDDDGSEPDADEPEAVEVDADGLLEVLEPEEESGEEDQPEDEPDNADSGEEVEESEDEDDEEPTPDHLLENAILDWVDAKGPREMTQIKSHFRKKKFGDRETKVAHITAALETLEKEEEIEKTANLVSIVE